MMQVKMQYKSHQSLSRARMFVNQSSCYWKFNEQDNLTENMLVKDGGRRRMWAGNPQTVVTEEGVGKGLQERGINTATNHAQVKLS